MPLLVIILLLAALIFALRKKIARLLERTEGPIARMRGNNRAPKDVNQNIEAAHYNAIHIAPNTTYYNPVHPPAYNYPTQQYPNTHYAQTQVFQSNYSQISINDATNARRDALNPNPYEMHGQQGQTGSKIGVNPYIR